MKPLGVGLYLAGINNVPVVAPSLFWVSGLVYHRVPSLNDLSSPQVAVLVAALTAGGIAVDFLAAPRTCLCKSLGRPASSPALSDRLSGSSGAELAFKAGAGPGIHLMSIKEQEQ